MRLRRFLAVAACLMAAMPAARAAASGDAAGYLLSAGGQPVMGSFGDCWHTGEWRPGMRFANCEPMKAAAASELPKSAPAARQAPPAAAPAPHPKPAAPFRLSADTLFQFDSAALTPQGRATLDSLAKRIAAADYRSVDIAGHADRLGTRSYNRSLSERRAEAVRDYLVQHGIDARRIRARGLGSAQPASSTAQCEGMPRARLIQCLQPDRYAEVTVVGTAHSAGAARPAPAAAAAKAKHA